MADAIPLSLRALPKVDPNKDSLPFLISCINNQRGSFRNFTEESLEEEIRLQENGQEESLEDDAPAEDTQDNKSRPEELAGARQEMLTQVQQAYYESTGALSLISLVLAGNSTQAGISQQALSTVDPYIKETLPKGALGVDKIQAPQKSETELQSVQMVELGWKTQSLKSAADSLLNSAARLEKELKAETRYWDQILKIKEQGWSVTRLPREKHALGVRFGFAEAHTDFRDRGMAALRRDEDGNISLDRGLNFAGDRKLRVRILQHGSIISCSRFSTLAMDAEEVIEDESIEEEILQARNSLFDEELHAELHREARNLANQGVVCIGDIVQLPYESDKSIQIDLIDIDEIASEGPRKADLIPTGIDIALHILLSHAHRQNLRRRSAPPPPVHDGRRPRPVYQILKPIIEHLRHRSNVQSCNEFIANLTKTLATADLVLALQKDTTSSWNIPDNITNPQNNNASATENLIQSLIAPPRCSLTLSPPSKQSLHNIDLLTNLFPPTFGTAYHYTIESPKPESMTAILPSTTSLTSVSDVQAHILHLLTVDLVDHITSSSPGWSVEDPHTGVLSRTFENRNEELESVTMRIVVEARKLVLEWVHHFEDVFARGGEARAKQSVVWGQGAASEKGLLDVIGDIVAGAS